MNFDPHAMGLLKQQAAEYGRLRQEMDQLYKKCTTMESLLPQLAAEAEAKEDAADRLEQGSLSSLFYSAMGKKEEKLEQAKREAQAAFYKYQDAERTLAELRQQRLDLSKRLSELEDSPRRYERALGEKRRLLLQMGGPQATKLQELSQKADAGQCTQSELQAAYNEGTRVLELMEELEELLHSASNWGMVDVIGGGFLTDMVKYDKLDRVRQLLDSLQRALIQYSGSIHGLELDLGSDMGVGSGLQFADFFLDNIFVDSFVLHQVQQIRTQISDAKRPLLGHLDLLQRKQRSMEQELSRLREEAETLILSANVDV